jgi:hypothetical protein
LDKKLKVKNNCYLKLTKNKFMQYKKYKIQTKSSNNNLKTSILISIPILTITKNPLLLQTLTIPNSRNKQVKKPL